jgi:hypothetical protein
VTGRSEPASAPIRGLEPDPSLRDRIMICTDLEQLGQWFRRAATARSLDELLAS